MTNGPQMNLPGSCRNVDLNRRNQCDRAFIFRARIDFLATTNHWSSIEPLARV
jgi:hypothetical protein